MPLSSLSPVFSFNPIFALSRIRFIRSSRSSFIRYLRFPSLNPDFRQAPILSMLRIRIIRSSQLLHTIPLVKLDFFIVSHLHYQILSRLLHTMPPAFLVEPGFFVESRLFRSFAFALSDPLAAPTILLSPKIRSS
jgi:hypothetical protein